VYVLAVAEEVQRGRLRDPSTGPATGEHVEQLAASEGLVVEHILSGTVETPVDYWQVEDEWVVLLTGSATLEVDGESLDLGPGDWLFLPARAPHRLVETTPGTSWLAVHRRVARFPLKFAGRDAD
jgi:cupin 2 domain-containing protein